MIIVNTTFVFENNIASEGLKWINESYIPSAKKCGASDNPAPMLTKVLGSADPESTTYALHVYFPDINTATKWNDGVGAKMRELLGKRWSERALTFSTYLEITE